MKSKIEQKKRIARKLLKAIKKAKPGEQQLHAIHAYSEFVRACSMASSVAGI